MTKQPTRRTIKTATGAAAGGIWGFNAGSAIGIAAPSVTPVLLGGTIIATNGAIPLAIVGAGAGAAAGHFLAPYLPSVASYKRFGKTVARRARKVAQATTKG